MRLLKYFRVYDLILIALMATLGIAAKPIVVPIAHMITGPLFIPGGAVAGGLYMFWIALAAGLVGKRGTATMTAFTQALIVIVTGAFGSHGIVSVITYTLPGFAIDAVFFIIRRRWETIGDFFLAGIIANLAGTYLSNLVFFRLPLIPLLMSLSWATLSGGIGGLIAYSIHKQIKKLEGVHDET
ncbi:ECF transporter S component [Fusibacter paucivorans]|uniref:ECF transporter S component n=1 Tax=Fusibacter paucivorans TaxID=76009 RepID=A0ABS5PP00_9FIRM|nr:ECF transporter S component [Fusibacter paucivorans]MBS7526900.1 ECF transporter S component [Fusibacter paucivorans]